MELYEAFEARKSTRSYTEEQVPEEKLQNILVAGGLAPIGLGKYDTLHFTVVQDKGLLAEMAHATAEVWQQPDADPMYGAPTLILVSAPELPAPHIEYCNVACALENMALEATGMGLGSIYLWGVVSVVAGRSDLLEKLRLPEGFRPISALAVGFAKEPLKPEKEWKPRVQVTRL